jgi:Bacterial Ig domain/FIMAH domain
MPQLYGATQGPPSPRLARRRRGGVLVAFRAAVVTSAALAVITTAGCNTSAAEVNSAPAVVPDRYTVTEATTLAVRPAGVLANDTDPDPGTTLEAMLVSGPVNGVLTLNRDGSFTYMPAAAFTGMDSFTYLASDGDGANSAPATVDITVVAMTAEQVLETVPRSAGDALRGKLAQAAQAYAAGRIANACAQLDAFLNQLAGFVPDTITERQATTLRAEVARLKARYGCR